MDDLSSDIRRAPELLFGESVLFELPERQPARQVAQAVSRALTVHGDLVAYRELLWRLKAVEHELERVPPGDVEGGLLRKIVEAIPHGEVPGEALRQSLANYADFLDRQGRLVDARGILALAARCSTLCGDLGYFGNLAMHTGRLNRLLVRWDLAMVGYEMAERAGAASGDMDLMLRGRTGRGLSLATLGMFAEAESVERSAAVIARSLSLRRIRLLVFMDLNTIFGNQDRHIEAIRAASAALDLASTDDEKTRALGDICVGLVDAGSPRPAIPMLKYVLQAAPCESTRINARLELMRIDVMLGNRIGFERSRESLEEICDAIAPSFAVDFRYKVALGHARFGRKKRARELLEEASAIAKMGNLVVWSRKLEKVV